MHEGRIIADGSVESLVASEARGTRVAVELEADLPAALAGLRALDTVAVVESATGTASAGRPEGRHGITVSGASGADPRREIFELAAARGWVLWELHLEQESLEDLFRELTTSHTEPNG